MIHRRNHKAQQGLESLVRGYKLMETGREREGTATNQCEAAEDQGTLCHLARFCSELSVAPSSESSSLHSTPLSLCVSSSTFCKGRRRALARVATSRGSIHTPCIVAARRWYRLCVCIVYLSTTTGPDTAFYSLGGVEYQPWVSIISMIHD